MRGRNKSSGLEGGGVEKIEECSKNVTSAEKGLIKKEKRMSNLITQYRRGHAIDQIAGG